MRSLLENAPTEIKKVRGYFSLVLIIFLLSFILMSSAKWTNNIFYALMGLPGLFFLFKGRDFKLFVQPLVWAWLAFLLWFLVPAVILGDSQFYKHIIYVSLFVFIVARLTDGRVFRSGVFARGLFWSIMAYVMVASVYRWSVGLSEFGQRVVILPGRMENVIYTSIWLLCAFGLTLPVWRRERRWLEAVCAVVMTLVAVAFVLQTRTALVGAVFLLGLGALYGLYHFPRRGLQVLLISSFVGILVLWFVHDQDWFLSLFARGDSSRVALFQIMTSEWQECGWALGCGVDFHTAQTLEGGIPIQHPHNIFVSLGVYTGGVSLFLFLVVVVLTLWHAWRERDPWGIYLACALVMLNFDGGKLIGNPDELWPLVLMPAALIFGRVLERVK